MSTSSKRLSKERLEAFMPTPEASKAPPIQYKSMEQAIEKRSSELTIATPKVKSGKKSKEASPKLPEVQADPTYFGEPAQAAPLSVEQEKFLSKSPNSDDEMVDYSPESEEEEAATGEGSGVSSLHTPSPRESDVVQLSRTVPFGSPHLAEENAVWDEHEQRFNNPTKQGVTVILGETQVKHPVIPESPQPEVFRQLHKQILAYTRLSGKDLDRMKLVSSKGLFHSLNRMWKDACPREYEGLEWSNPLVPMRVVCEAWLSTLTNREMGTSSKLKALEEAMYQPIVVKPACPEARMALYKQYGSILALYEDAIKAEQRAARDPRAQFSVGKEESFVDGMMRRLEVYDSKNRLTGEFNHQIFRHRLRSEMQVKCFHDFWSALMDLSQGLVSQCADLFYEGSVEGSPTSSPRSTKSTASPMPVVAIAQPPSRYVQPNTDTACRQCGHQHAGHACWYGDHGMCNRDLTLQWRDSPAGQYFARCGQHRLVPMTFYWNDPAFPPSLVEHRWTKPDWVGERRQRGQNREPSGPRPTKPGLIPKKRGGPEADRAVSSSGKTDCAVNMYLMCDQEQGNVGINAHAKAKEEASFPVNVLLDTGNSGVDLIASDVVESARVITYNNNNSFVVRLLNSHTIALNTLCNITLGITNTYYTYTFNTLAYLVPSLPYDVVLGLQTIREHRLFERCSQVLNLPTGAQTKDRLQRSATVAMIQTEDWNKKSSPSNFSQRNPYDLEELAEIKDDDLQAIPTELVDNTSDDEERLFQDLLTNRLHGPRALQVALKVLLIEYRDRFSARVQSTPAKCSEFTMRVDVTKWCTPANQGRPRRHPLQREKELNRMVQILLMAGLVVPSKAAYYSHGFVVPKSVLGSWRLVIDYRGLNLATLDAEHWPIPNIKQLIARLGAKRALYYAVFDFTSGYHQAGVAPEARQFTAFMTGGQILEWLRLPMGLKGAPSFFQRVVSQEVLYGLMYDICELYMDDIIIFAETEEEFVAAIKKVLARFREHNITVNPAKCVLGVQHVEYVGHVVSRQGVSFSRSKLDKVNDITLPETMGQLKAFLGLANWFGTHVHNYAITAVPLYALLNGAYVKKRPLEWTEEAKKAFYKLRQDVVTCTPLWFMDDVSPILLQTDASDYGIGACLLQKKEGRYVPIALLSKKLNATQINWSTPEKEAFAIFHTLKTWDYLLRDRKFTLHTDHANLRQLQLSCRETQKVTRWFQAIQQYDMEITYIPGITNVVADALSRSVQIDSAPKAQNEMRLCLLAEDFALNQPTYDLIAKCHSHSVGHGGIERTLARVREYGSWPHQRTQVRAFIRRCPWCQKMTQVKPCIKARRFCVSSLYPMQQIAIDFLEGLPAEEGTSNDSICVIIDTFTRFIELYPTRGTSAQAVCRALLNHFGRYGLPDVILTDNGPAFSSDVIAQLTTLLDIDHDTITPYSHEENGIVERANKEVIRHLEAIVFDRQLINQWSMVLPLVMRIMNSSVHSSTGTAPASLLFGNAIDLDRHLFSPVDHRHPFKPDQNYVDQLIRVQEQVFLAAQQHLQQKMDAHLTDSAIADTYYPINSFVLVQPRTGFKRKKMRPAWLGPYRVLNITDEGRQYSLQDLITGQISQHHITRLKAYVGDISSIAQLQKVAVADKAGEYLVEEISAIRGLPRENKDRVDKSKLELRVHWVGYDGFTWEPFLNFERNQALHDFLRSHRNVRVRNLLLPRFR